MKQEYKFKQRSANSTYTQVAVQWLNQALCFYQIWLLFFLHRNAAAEMQINRIKLSRLADNHNLTRR